MLLQRILTAAVGIPVTVYIIDFGGWLFAVSIIALALIAWREYNIMLRKISINTGMIGGAAVILLLLMSAWCGNSEEIVFSLWIGLLWSLIRTLKLWQNAGQSFLPAAFSLFGVLYIGLSFMHLLLLREASTAIISSKVFGDMTVGTVYLWVAFLATWASDTFAYFVGSAMGRRKLAPHISPKKSVEGFIGGIVGAMLAVAVFGYFTSIPLIHRLMTGALVGLVAPVGDLAESALKRYCCVKDSGTLLPGHGGVLDRFDSILFSVPAVYYYMRLFVLQ